MREFESPGSQYRGKPFWAWNGKLEPEELRRQIRIMHRMGLGGFFMHSRVGLDTAYLSDEWFECVEACIDEAEKLDMEAWLYDEDRWPSGAAGGLVTCEERFRMRSLALNVIKKVADLKWDKSVVAVFTAKIDGASATNVRRITRGKQPEKLEQGASILVFSVKLQDTSSWYNDYTYLDTLNHEAVKKFIEVTHEEYRKRIGKHFGKRVPGIFTDEPNFGGMVQGASWVGAGGAVWTGKLPEVFKERYGYDLLDHLVEIFFDVDGLPVTPARLHYHDCVTFLFVDAFSRQIGEFCEKNGIQSTGHVLEEATLSTQTGHVGSSMLFYEYMQAPGMDILTEQWREYDTAKQVSSAARQFGHKWRLTETYGCTGWDFPFAGHKAIGDWQVALGINLRCQHLSWYTMEGQAKRDYPASIFYQSPWWEMYSKVEDYFARIHAVMTRGREVRDLLVVHPVESMWMLCKSGWGGSPEVKKYDEMLIGLRDQLLARNIDFDYGDEDIIDRYARAGKKEGVPTLFMGQARYKAVLVPPLLTIRKSTLDLLRRFQALGGLVVFVDEPAQYVDGVVSEEAARLAEECTRVSLTGKSLMVATEKVCRRVTITGPDEEELVSVLHLLREDKDAFYLFVCNVGHDFLNSKLAAKKDPRVCERTLSLGDVRIGGFADCKGMPLELDPDTGKVYEADARHSWKGWDIRTNLPAVGSRLFVIPRKEVKRSAVRRKNLVEISNKKISGSWWDIVLSEDNNLVLDRPKFRIGNSRLTGPDEILCVDTLVREELGIPIRGGQMVQPWARPKAKKPESISVELSYCFMLKTVPTGNLNIAIEQAARYQVTVNGTSIDTNVESGWWTDRSLRKIPIHPSLLFKGENEIKLKCDYDETHPGLEIIYLLGSFGTRVRGTDLVVTEIPRHLKVGDWVKQGLAFYSGSVCYNKRLRPKLRKGERLFVQVPDYRGVAVRIWVDGKSAGIVAWEPNEVELTDFITGDKMELGIEVIGHRRNSHGPFHFVEKWPEWSGPDKYIPEGDNRVDTYQLVPCGLKATPRLIVRK